MAELDQLKKRLRGVQLSGQIARAVKTSATAKLSIINGTYANYRSYVEALENIVASCSLQTEAEYDSLSLDSENSEAKLNRCYVILGHNKGLCGSFNSELHSFAENYITKHGKGEIYVCGKCAISYFEEHIAPTEIFILPDIPNVESCQGLFRLILNKLIASHSTVTLIYQQFINTLTQTPASRTLYPPIVEMQKNNKKPDIVEMQKNNQKPDKDIIWIPDRITVLKALQNKFYETVLYKLVLESALGAQAATLVAMRTAYDNATETAEALENEINKTRQSAVTTGVLEMAASMTQEWEG